jgi:hypothetical protein
MLKPLTLSLSLAVALGFCSVSKAGLCNKMASGQCPTPCASEQCPQPSAQCPAPCKKKCCLSGLFQHKPKCYCYEWVLKKKKCGGMFGHNNGCDVCGSPIYASGQCGSAQAYGSGQVYGAGQSGGMAPMSGDEAPPAPAADGQAPSDAAPAAPAAPATPPAANATQGSLLFMAPAGN